MVTSASAGRMTQVKVLKILAGQDTKTMLGDFRKRKHSPFRILIGTILSARAKDETTLPITEKLFKRYPNASELAKARASDVKKIIKSIGFYNNKAKNIVATARMIVNDFDGKIPDNFEDLMKLAGVGRKVAGCVLVYAFGKEAIPVDTHVHRLSNRLGWVKTKTPEKTEKALEKLFPKRYWMLINDTLVHHGKTICQPITPRCLICPVAGYCKKIGVRNVK